MSFEPPLPFSKPSPTQLAMTGDDWKSDRDVKAKARAEAARKKAAVECARKLEVARDALNAYLLACTACNDASRSRGPDDGRTILMGSMSEYAAYLRSVYDK
ncbi:hypothetical protein DBB29_25010 [Pandoraea cepalis]|uniref:Uncharacterized protein n=1 Tax=Pandoraea cepalis TaxID=2508294 RepID=A0AAW7MGR9_9BURK|nr:hypothetical protein [Pandoraea cepalis]MDN4571923.1 hypothetical protein [Pandoraea cepalis]MDN4581377.1 hypothetical protein [Pandoraea cepalis]